LLGVEEGSIAGMGDARVVRIRSFLAVVASGEWNAVRASRALVARWEERKAGAEGVYALVRGAEVVGSDVFKRVGDSQAALAGAARRVEASYDWPIQSHASMGPSCAVADVRDGGRRCGRLRRGRTRTSGFSRGFWGCRWSGCG
jgi:CO/xanthine dehydrogenase Mo-binding subunit